MLGVLVGGAPWGRDRASPIHRRRARAASRVFHNGISLVNIFSRRLARSLGASLIIGLCPGKERKTLASVLHSASSARKTWTAPAGCGTAGPRATERPRSTRSAPSPPLRSLQAPAPSLLPADRLCPSTDTNETPPPTRRQQDGRTTPNTNVSQTRRLASPPARRRRISNDGAVRRADLWTGDLHAQFGPARHDGGASRRL